MDSRVEGFPFNIVENPMYDGSTMCFLATALWYGQKLFACFAMTLTSGLGTKSQLAS